MTAAKATVAKIATNIRRIAESLVTAFEFLVEMHLLFYSVLDD